ncbi:MAG: hypothetical protein HYX50_06005 [Chloroflexi bacterium]|nr:hypothetical protein [Chloroflexota bacterium]
MRPLSAELLAAQRSASAEPRVDVSVENSVAGARRYDFAQLDATANTIARHGAAVAADGSLTRVRSDGAGAVLRQRVVNPAVGPWSTWLTQATGKGAQVAVAAKGARVVIAYTDAAGTGIKLVESTDSGATFGAEVAVTTAAAALTGLAVACKNSSGDVGIAWTTAATLSLIKRTSGAFGAASASGISVSSLNGLALVYAADWDIALTGVEATSLRRTLWTIIFGDGGDVAANTWGALMVQQQAESDSSVSYAAPSIVYTDSYRITFVELDAFTGGATRTWRASLHPSTTFASGANAFRTPAPVAYTGAEGLALTADAGAAGYVYECAPDAVYRASRAQALLTLTDSVVAVRLYEGATATSGEIDLDNSAGAFAGPLPPIAIGNLVALAWGYRASAGYQSSRMADLWVAGVEYVREGGLSLLRLHLEGGWEVLRRNHQRTQVVHTGTETAAQVLQRILARAGLLLSGTMSARAGALTPKFTVHPATSAFTATQQLLALLADRLRMTANAGVEMLEPLGGDATAYAWGQTHPVHQARLLIAPAAANQAQVFGAGAYGEAIDFPSAALALGAPEQQRDANAATAAAAAATAVATLRRRALEASAGRIAGPPNCGQQILDVIDFTDALVSPAAVRRRVAAIDWRYDRRRAVYEQTLTLGPV